MDIPHVSSYEDMAIDTVVNILNTAKYRIGSRQNLHQLATSRDTFLKKTQVSLQNLESPLVKSCQELITETIVVKWKLTKTVKFILRYLGGTADETAHYLYYEAVFSQPTESYPIPQATASVFFRVEDKHLEPTETKKLPKMTFRIGCENTDHDIRYVRLTDDWILANINMKLKLYERIEKLRI